MSEDVEPSPAKPPRVEALYDGREVTVIVDSNLDLTSSLRFRVCVDEALGMRPGSIAVDARGVTFVDASGMAALLRARHAATEAGVPFRVSRPSQALRRVAQVAGFRELLADE